MIEPISLAEWEAFDKSHPAPTFFARPAWATALHAALAQWEPFPLRVRARGGTVIVPFVRGTGGKMRWSVIVGFPYGGYTCALREDGSLATPEEAASAVEQIATTFDYVRLCPWPVEASFESASAWKTLRHETAVIDLAEGADVAIERFDGVSRRMAAQAFRRGVVCERCDDDDAVDQFYAILEEAARHWGLLKPTYPKALLSALMTHSTNNAEIWFARYGGEPIAGGVVLYGAREMFFWSAAMLRSHARLRPSNALNVALITAAASRGIRWYNLGASEGLPGVARFKEGLGARSVPYAELSHERPLFAFYTQIRASCARAIGAH